MQVSRYDSGTLSKAGETPSGGARVKANLARTGIQRYRRADGSVRVEYRPPEEVFREKSLASYVGAPVTVGHPAKVDRKSWKRDTAGVVVVHPHKTALHDGEQYVTTVVDVNEDQALDGVESGRLVELSVGYTCDFDPTPGVTPKGEKYDGVQRNIRVNHVALLPEGAARAGRLARLVTDSDEIRLDDNGDQILVMDQEDWNDHLAGLLKDTRVRYDGPAGDVDAFNAWLRGLHK